jgi:hypothetical protein
MSTIDTTAQTADSNCYGAHPSHSGTKRKPPWDRRVLLSANGAMSQGPVRPRDPRSPAARCARQTTRSADIGNAIPD